MSPSAGCAAVGDAGDQLPLHTVHGIGYVFLGKLREFAEP